MTRRLRGIRSVAVVFALLGTLGAVAEPGATCKEDTGCSDVVRTTGLELCSTADDARRRIVEPLLAASREATALPELTIDYPLDETIFPPEILAPTFLWHDPVTEADRWLVQVSFGDGSSVDVLVPGAPESSGEIDSRAVSITNEVYQPTAYQASARSWKPGPQVWAAIRDHAVDNPASLSFVGFSDADPGRPLSRGRLSFRTSRDPVGAPIFYRDVPLMPSKTKDGVIKPLDQSALPLINWRLKDISRRDSRVLLKDMTTCANCHSFSADGKTLGMDVDGPDGDKGAYGLAPIDGQVVIETDNVMTWNAFGERPPGQLIFGFLSRVSPDGRYVVSTVNEAMFVRNFTDFRFLQVFFPTRGILAFYSRETKKIQALAGADDPRYVQCNAVWTPDGRTVIFARAEARDPYDLERPVATYAGDPNETQIRYDLYSVPFNGGRGGTATPIRGASHNGRSNSFPKVSPDGKWLVWVQSKNGMLMRPDGKLWIAPVGGGEPRMMRCNTSLMNSWHSFSPNSRWMVFSSKSNRPYTQMFLTHIDENGNDSPPVLIENATAANRAVNIPEFVNLGYDSFAGISVPAVDHREHFNRGDVLSREGRHREAVAQYTRALEGEEQDWRVADWRIHDSMSKALLRLGNVEGALQHIYASLKINPFNAEMHANLGYILFGKGDLPQAVRHLDAAVELAPRDAAARYNRGTLRMTLGDLEGAIDDYTRAIGIAPDYAEAYGGRGAALLSAGDRAGARVDFDAAIRLMPQDPTPWYLRARLGKDEGRLDEALRDLAQARAVCAADSPRLVDIEALQRDVRAATGGDRIGP